jgi:hypothetical protein
LLGAAAASSLPAHGLQAGIGSKLAQVVDAVASSFGEQPQASIWSALLRQVRWHSPVAIVGAVGDRDQPTSKQTPFLSVHRMGQLARLIELTDLPPLLLLLPPPPPLPLQTCYMLVVLCRHATNCAALGV